MKKLEISQMEKIEGGKFWGTGKVLDCQDNPLGGQWCRECSQDYMLWIPVGGLYGCKDFNSFDPVS